jgi:uncharacterized small protein (DUF1192 family)
MNINEILQRYNDCKNWPNASCLTVAQTGVLFERISALEADKERLEGELAQKDVQISALDDVIAMEREHSSEQLRRAETERDAAMLWAVGRDLGLTAVGLGGASHRPDRETHELLLSMDVVLCALDNDEPAQDGKVPPGAKHWAGFWRPTYANAVRHLVPRQYGKDPGDAVGKLDLLAWLRAGIPRHVLDAIDRDLHKAQGPKGSAAAAQPEGVRRMLALLGQCRRVWAYAGAEGMGLAGCDGCPKQTDCPIRWDLLEAIWVDEAAKYLEEKGRVRG